MPRSKQRPERSGTGEGSSGALRVQARRRRYESHACVLRELRHIERHMQPAIPRLPFQRLVREICENWCIGCRWTPSAILCLQEITEDFLIEFFEDSYTLAAFAHRVTIMPRDFQVLQCLRYRYDQLIVPGTISDRRMIDILSVPPLHPRSQAVPHYQAVHDRNTRSQAWRSGKDVIPECPGIVIEDVTNEMPGTAPESSLPVEQEPSTASPEREKRATAGLEAPGNVHVSDAQIRVREIFVEELEAHNNAELIGLAAHNTVNLEFVFGSGENTRTVVGSLDRVDLNVLQNSDALEMTDRIMQATLWYSLSTLPNEVQESTYFVDSLLSTSLRNNGVDFLQLLHWFRPVNLDLVKNIVMAYHEQEHWSFFAFCIERNTCFYANSLGRYHGRVRECGRRFVTCMEHLLLENFADTVTMTRLSVPIQPRDVSCGWRTCLNAHLFLKRVHNIPDERELNTYTPWHVKEFRIRAIQRIIVAVHERAQQETARAAEAARVAEQRQIAADEQTQREILAYQEAINDYARLQAEVDEFLARRNLQSRVNTSEAASQSGPQSEETHEAAWRAMEEATAEANMTRQSQTRPAPRPPSAPRRQRRPRAPRAPRGSRS